MKHEAEQLRLGLLPEDQIHNEGAGEVWKRSEVDKALDEYFAGAHPKELGIKYKKAPKAFRNSILYKLRENYKKKGKEDKPGRAERYEPFRRVSRKGMRFTPNEQDIIQRHRELKVDPKVTARILMRDVEEFSPDTEGQNQVNGVKQIVPTLDLVLAYRYSYHVYDKKLISDKTYDDLKAEEIEFGTGSEELGRRPKDCPHYIKTLALYLTEKYGAK